MLLFPGETTPFHVVAQNGRRVAVCGGQCDRSDRPLSCRLFPFLPVPTDDGTISVRLDMRGRGVCPLVRLEKEAAFSHRFLHRVQRAGEQLRRDTACRAFLEELQAEIGFLEALGCGEK